MISHQDSSSPLKIEDIKVLRVLQSDTNSVTVEALLKSDLVTLKIEKPTWRWKPEDGLVGVQKERIQIVKSSPLIIEETPELYEKQTGPGNFDPPDHTWMLDCVNKKIENHNIKKEDKEMIVFKNEDKAQKSQGKVKSYLTLVKRDGIKSLRDLDQSHLNLLRSALKLSQETVAEELGLHPDEVSVYVHYPPTYWRLHIHCAKRASRPSAREHPLENIIKNIEEDPSYYKKATLKRMVMVTESQIVKNLIESRYFEKTSAPFRRSAERNSYNSYNRTSPRSSIYEERYSYIRTSPRSGERYSYKKTRMNSNFSGSWRSI